MKIRVTINEGPIKLDEVFEGSSDEELFRKFKDGAAARAPFVIKMAMKGMSDKALCQQVVESYNHKFGTKEPVPSCAQEFIAFGERAGFLKRI
jgi:hypothetical protein